MPNPVIQSPAVSAAHSAVSRAFSRTEMPDTGDDAAQDDPMRPLGNIGGLLHRVQVFAPRTHIPPAAEIRAQEGLGIDHAVRRAFLQHRQHQPVIILAAFAASMSRLRTPPENARNPGRHSRPVRRTSFEMSIFFSCASPRMNAGGAPPSRCRCNSTFGRSADTHKKLRPGPCAGTPRCAATRTPPHRTNPINPISRAPSPCPTTGTRSRV